MPGALAHIRVLDFTRILAGPWATQTLADLGADVIKVERPGAGDDTRQFGPPWVRDAEGRETADSAYFTSANRNKRSVTIDIAQPAGQALVREIAAKSDVFFENYKVGDLKRYGLAYEDIRKINPGIVYCSLTGYGQDGPYAKRPGYDFVFQAEGGLMSITGEREELPGGGPMKVGIGIADVLTGLYASIGILAALEARRATGEGQHIDIALLDTIVAFGANQILGYFVSGEIPGLFGNAHPNIVPYQAFKTADGRIVVACANDAQFRRLCEALERPDLAADERFRTVSLRNMNREPLCAELQRTLLQKPSAWWLERLVAAQIASGPINNYKQVFEHPQVVHRKLRVELPNAAGGGTPVVANPLRLSATPVEYPRGAPLLGQHTEEVLRELLGKSAADIESLAKSKVV